MASSGQERFREQLRRYLETGASFSKLSRTELEDLAREYLGRDAPGRERIEDAFEEVRARSRRGIDLLFDLVRAEVRREVENVAARRRDEFVDVFERGFSLLGEFLGRHANSSEEATPEPEHAAEVLAPTKLSAKKAPAKRTGAKKAPAKKAAAKKAASASAPAKKIGVTKTPAKKAPAKKAAPRPRPEA